MTPASAAMTEFSTIPHVTPSAASFGADPFSSSIGGFSSLSGGGGNGGDPFSSSAGFGSTDFNTEAALTPSPPSQPPPPPDFSFDNSNVLGGAGVGGGNGGTTPIDFGASPFPASTDFTAGGFGGASFGDFGTLNTSSSLPPSTAPAAAAPATTVEVGGEAEAVTEPVAPAAAPPPPPPVELEDTNGSGNSTNGTGGAPTTASAPQPSPPPSDMTTTNDVTTSATAPGGTHNLMIAEVVNAHLRGRKLTQYQVVGELRVVPVSVPCPPSEFRFRLRNTHRIEQLKVNEKFVKAASGGGGGGSGGNGGGGEYVASLPAMTQAKPVPLIKYVAAAKWRPVPLFVDLAVEGGSSGGGGGEGGENGNGGEGGPAGLRAVVQTNSQLKSALQNVLVTVTPPDGYRIIHSENGDENQNARLKPEGSTWDAASRKLLWRVSKELVRETPVTCTAGLISDASSSNGNGKDGSSSSEAELASAFQSVPFHVQFGCEGVTISGIELEVQLSGGGSGAPPIAKLMRRFTAGEYRVTLPRLTDVSGGLASGERRLSHAERRESDDAEPRRDSKED